VPRCGQRTFRYIVTAHSGQSSQRLSDAHDRNAQFLATAARRNVSSISQLVSMANDQDNRVSAWRSRPFDGLIARSGSTILHIRSLVLLEPQAFLLSSSILFSCFAQYSWRPQWTHSQIVSDVNGRNGQFLRTVARNRSSANAAHVLQPIIIFALWSTWCVSDDMRFRKASIETEAEG
jgi:hypothetical protein